MSVFPPIRQSANPPADIVDLEQAIAPRLAPYDIPNANLRLPIFQGCTADGRQAVLEWTATSLLPDKRQAEEAAGRADLGYSCAPRASGKEMAGPAAERDAVAHLRAMMGLSECRVCQIISAERKLIRYKSCRPSEGRVAGYPFANGKPDDVPSGHSQSRRHPGSSIASLLDRRSRSSEIADAADFSTGAKRSIACWSDANADLK